MRYLTVLLLAALSIPLHAQSNQAELYAMESTTIAAELMNKLDTKNARVGDTVSLATTCDARVSDGSRLPKGTRLTGHVTEVHPRSDSDKTSHLALLLDRAVLRDGTALHLHITIIGMAIPSETMPGGPLPMPGADSAPSAAPAGRRGGVGGGGVGTTSKTGGVSTSAVNSIGTGNSPSFSAAMQPPLDAARPVVNAGTSANEAAVLKGRHVPVGGMPGVTLSSSIAATDSGTLDATGRNITIEPGIQLTLNVIATAR